MLDRLWAWFTKILNREFSWWVSQVDSNNGYYIFCLWEQEGDLANANYSLLLLGAWLNIVGSSWNQVVLAVYDNFLAHHFYRPVLFSYSFCIVSGSYQKVFNQRWSFLQHCCWMPETCKLFWRCRLVVATQHHLTLVATPRHIADWNPTPICASSVILLKFAIFVNKMGVHSDGLTDLPNDETSELSALFNKVAGTVLKFWLSNSEQQNSRQIKECLERKLYAILSPNCTETRS